MNNVSDYNKCANCGACYNSCPTNAITVEKSELFYSLHIDEKRCISCGLCKEVCPVNKPLNKQNIVSAWSAIHNDEDVVISSSSGGVFSAIANKVLNMGGVVYGAAYSEDCMQVDILSTADVKLEQLCKSKYVESLVGFSFREVKANLEKGIMVLFCAAPCQIAGLKRYLKKDYDNLITCDFSCGGMPSHGVYEQYLDGIEKKLRGKISKVDFRPKIYGWTNHAIKITAENGKVYKRSAFSDPYFDCFIGQNRHSTIREYCLNCEFANNHYADIILADFWKYRQLSKLPKDDKGISLIIANSEKGAKIVEVLNGTMSLTRLDSESAMYNLVTKNADEKTVIRRKAFLDKCTQEGFWKSTKSLPLKSQFVFKLKYAVKRLLGR